MFSSNKMKVIGFRWVSNRHSQACKECARLHDQEFYYEPWPGQKDAADAPKPPLHPNCRCRREDIVAVDDSAVREVPGRNPTGPGQGRIPPPILSVDYEGKHNNYFDFVWEEDGRPLSGGPGYGYYGGGYRSRGRNTYGMTEEQIEKLPRPEPVDLLDAACEAHDNGYAACRKKYTDKEALEECEIGHDWDLVHAARNLPASPDKRGRGKVGQKEKEYATRYRKRILLWFSQKIDIYDGKNEGIYISP